MSEHTLSYGTWQAFSMCLCCTHHKPQTTFIRPLSFLGENKKINTVPSHLLSCRADKILPRLRGSVMSPCLNRHFGNTSSKVRHATPLRIQVIIFIADSSSPLTLPAVVQIKRLSLFDINTHVYLWVMDVYMLMGRTVSSTTMNGRCECEAVHDKYQKHCV